MNYVRLILFSFLIVSNSFAAENYDEPFSRHLMRKILNGVFYLVASDAETADRSFTENLMKEIDPSAKLLAVKKFNWFGQRIFGRHNTIALPFLNYVIINSHTLNQLSPEARRFAIGRSLLSLNEPIKYIGYKYILPSIMHIISEALIPHKDREYYKPLTGPEELALFLVANENMWPREFLNHTVFIPWRAQLLKITSKLLKAYCSRKVEQNLDHEAATKLNAASGGIELLQNYAKFGFHIVEGYKWDPIEKRLYIVSKTEKGVEHRLYLNPNDLSGIEDFYDPYELGFFLGLFEIIAFTCQFTIGLEAARNNHTPMMSYVPYIKWFESIRKGIKDHLPGQNTPFSHQMWHSLYSLPLVSWFNHFPTTRSRIEELKKLNGKSTAET